MNITENIQRIQQAKIDIRNAIIQKGVAVDNTLTIDNFADKILQIEGGGGGGDELAKSLIQRDATTINIPQGTTKIGTYAFYAYSGLTSVSIPNSVTSIEANAFLNCSRLTSVNIPNSVTSVGTGVFSGCTSLTSVTISNSVTSIMSSVFSDCTSLTSVTIPDSVTSIMSSAFYKCSSLTDITIPNSVTLISTSVFRNCSGLTSTTWNSTQQYIPSYIFQNCSKLKVLDLSGGATQVMRFGSLTGTVNGTTSHIATNALQYIVIPDSLYDEWYASSYWANFTNYLIKKSDYDAL